MKSTVTEAAKSYPVLMSSPNGEVVMFTSPNLGVVVNSELGHYQIGYYSDNWFESKFKMFNGTIELSN